MHRKRFHKCLISGLAILTIRLYQVLISPVIGPACRFYPSCSQYAIESIRKHGLIKGCWYALKRFLKCHPWGAGGFDPVP
ncbi:MAG: membrane protein insertion efficiency factor YidD [Desulfobacteraceae bacterium]|nr:membrane protein insertion efficiency factor YidD [Desulfobacteraceae bacterium]